MKAMEASDQGDERRFLEIQKLSNATSDRNICRSFVSSLAKLLTCGSALEILAHIPSFVVILIVRPVGPNKHP